MMSDAASPLVERYRQAFALSPVPVLLASPDGRIRLVNDELATMFGYVASDLAGEPVERLLPEEHRAQHPMLRAAYQKLPARRRMGQGRDLEGLTRSGRRIPLELGLSPVEVDGEVWTLVTAVDTSARKRDDALARATLDAAASAMVMVDGTGSIVSVNPAALALFGYDEAELVGQRVEMLLPEDLQDRHRVYVQSFFELSTERAMGAGAPLFGRHKSGATFRIEAALTPVEVRDETMVLATLVDLSERLAAERAEAERAAAEAQSEKLARLNDDLTQFAYAASHDLKAPLATIVGMLRLSLEDLEAGDVATVTDNLEKLLELALGHTERLEAVLHLARVGHDEAPLAPVDLGSLARTVWSRITLGAADPPTLDYAEHLAEPFVSVPSALEVILEKLLSNAYRYRDDAKDERWARVNVRDDGDAVLLTVADNGIGFEESREEMIFRMFQRLSARSGHGLGLAIVRRQTEGLGGTVRCRSLPGAGTEFEVRLPKHS